VSPAEFKKTVALNHADKEELMVLPGVGEAIAARIITYRQVNGEFTECDQLLNIKGIGNKKFSNLKDLITL